MDDDRLSVSVESWGCTMNHGEACAIMWMLEEAGYRIEGSWKKADACILVTCVVIETTERKMLRAIAERLMASKPLIVAGCLATHPDLERMDLPSDITVIGPDGYHNIVDELAVKMNRIADPSKPIPARTDEGAHGHNILHRLAGGTIGILPIAQGCLGSCSYCITRTTRGRLKSYDPELLVCQMMRLIELGRKEVQVTAQDTACYGRDTGILLPRLMDELLKVDGEYMVRIGMMRPDSLEVIIDDLIAVYQNERVFKFLHLPVQSGSDMVLAAMNRSYTVERFEALVARFRDAFADMVLSTDVIIGYPTETEQDRKMTMDLLERLDPDILNITRFSARPHTPAASLEPVFHGRTTKAWSRALTVLDKRAGEKRNQKWLGWKGRVFVTEKGRSRTSLARMPSYRQVVVEGEYDCGQWVEIEVTGATHQYLVARGE